MCLESTIKSLAAELGFALCGIAEARPSEHADHVRRWLAAGRHGEMGWLADHLDERLDPAALLPGARSVICVADYVGKSDRGPRIAEVDDPAPHFRDPQSEIRDPVGRIARYAQFDDYHKVLKKRLQTLADRLRELAPEAQTRICVDTAPVLEREHAMRAGLGWVGKNTLTIHPRIGSHLLLGEIFTTLDLAPDEAEPDHCGSCTRCIDACPTQCITPYSVDAARCISYLTIEHRGPIDPAFHGAIGDWLYGCDICQDVCPYNNRTNPLPAATPPQYHRRPATLAILDVLNWDEEARRAAFTRSAMKRAKLDQMKRNALIVAGNLLAERADPMVRQRVVEISDDERESPMVRQTAQDVLGRR